MWNFSECWKLNTKNKIVKPINFTGLIDYWWYGNVPSIFAFVGLLSFHSTGFKEDEGVTQMPESRMSHKKCLDWWKYKDASDAAPIRNQ